MEHSKDFPDSFFRVTIKGLCVKDGKLLMVKQPLITGCIAWELPGGGLDFGETPDECLRREIKEEMKLNLKNVSDKPHYAWTYKYENSRKMDWYYVLVLCYRIEFEDLNSFVSNKESIDIKFFNKEELSSIDRPEQMNKLPDIFDPKDFEGKF